MAKISIVGWRVGLKKISMNDVLRERLSIGLSKAKKCVDDVLDGKAVLFILEDLSGLESLARSLEAAGAVVEIEVD